jgi:hypothetical protein
MKRPLLYVIVNNLRMVRFAMEPILNCRHISIFPKDKNKYLLLIFEGPKLQIIL